MYETPEKNFYSKNTSLRQKIQNKLSTDKKILDSKQNIFKKYQSHTQNLQQSKLQERLNQNKFKSNKKECLELKENYTQFLQTKQNQSEPRITENKILEYESLQNQNFYGINEWVEFNKKFFSHVDDQNVRNLWKIMRIINYGDVLIPSGLIFQVSKVLTLGLKKQRRSLKQVFNEFLKFNNAKDQVNNFRELKNYPSFQEIERKYLKIKEPKTEKKSLTSKGKLYSSLKKLPQNKDVFSRVYEDARIRTNEKSLSVYKSLLEKQAQNQCSFKPKINTYCSDKLFADETLRPQRVCNSKNKWITEKMMENLCIGTNSFKASPFQRSRFENKSLQQIPGVSQYIDRQKYSEAQKRKLQRYKQRPVMVFPHD